MKKAYMTSVAVLSLLILIGGGCVTIENVPPPEGSSARDTLMQIGGSIPDAPVEGDILFGATSPQDFAGMWTAPDLDKVISFDSFSGDNGNGMFHVDGMEGYYRSGIWYLQNGLFHLTSYDNETVNAHYKYVGITDTEISLETLTGESLTWTKK
jgi:hypothetical protein